MSPPTVADLLAHAPFLERLARSLVADEHAARDLVQETWAAALERPPRHGRNPRAWLGVVMRRRAARMRARPGVHVPFEAGDARDARAPENESREVYARLSSAVNELDEPYRGVVLARFYEGLAPREIAARLELPVSTVHTRLQRALAMLRARLDRDGDRRSWVGALLVLPGERRKGSSWMGTRTVRLVAGVLVGGLAGLPFLLSFDGRDSSVARAASSEPLPARAEVVVEPAPTAARSPVEAAEPNHATLEVRVVTLEGEPDRGASIRALTYPPGLPVLEHIGHTDEDGRLRVEVIPTLVRPDSDPTLGGHVGLIAVSRNRVPSRMTFVEAGRGDLELVLGPPGVPLQGTIRDVAGTPIENALVSVGIQSAIEERDGVFQHIKPRMSRSAANGSYQVHQNAPGAHAVHVTAPGFVLGRAWWSGRADERVDFVLNRGGALAGTVTDPDGRPVPGAEIWTSLPSGHEKRVATRSGADGTYVLGALPPGVVLVFAESPADPGAIAAELLEVDEGETREWSPRLRPTPGLSLALVDERGQPLPEWGLHLVDSEGEWTHDLLTDVDGKARIRALPDRPVDVYARGPRVHDGSERPILPVLRGARPRPETVRVVVPTEAPNAQLRGELIDSGGHPFPSAWVVAQRSGDRPQYSLAVDAETARFESPDLLPGEYRLTAFCPPFGAAELETVTLAAGEELDLGLFEAPRTGRLALTGRLSPGERLDIVYHAHGTTWVARVLHVLPKRPLVLLVGDVEVQIHRGGGRFVRRLELRADALTTVDLDERTEVTR